MTTYEPGMVAVATVCDIPNLRVFRIRVADELRWHTEGFTSHMDADVTDIRPLVVLDPERREQVERLWRTWTNLAPDHRLAQDNMQAALREFANLKPPEPTGLGAVVVDAEGNRWVRTTQYVTSHRNDWHREAGTSTGADRRHWDGINVVGDPLSEGVQP